MPSQGGMQIHTSAAQGAPEGAANTRFPGPGRPRRNAAPKRPPTARRRPKKPRRAPKKAAQQSENTK
eukprot:5025737-Pyramimonas_sp.AAC.1